MMSSEIESKSVQLPLTYDSSLQQLNNTQEQELLLNIQAVMLKIHEQNQQCWFFSRMMKGDTTFKVYVEPKAKFNFCKFSKVIYGELPKERSFDVSGTSPEDIIPQLVEDNCFYCNYSKYSFQKIHSEGEVHLLYYDEPVTQHHFVIITKKHVNDDQYITDDEWHDMLVLTRKVINYFTDFNRVCLAYSSELKDTHFQLHVMVITKTPNILTLAKKQVYELLPRKLKKEELDKRVMGYYDFSLSS